LGQVKNQFQVLLLVVEPNLLLLEEDYLVVKLLLDKEGYLVVKQIQVVQILHQLTLHQQDYLESLQEGEHYLVKMERLELQQINQL
jgi:hypothetical protein